MQLVFFLLAFSGMVELLVHVVRSNHTGTRKVAAYAAIVIIAAVTTALLLYNANLFSVLLAVLSLFRIFNMSRIIKGRMHAAYLWHVTFRTSIWFISAQLLIAGIWLIWEYMLISTLGIWLMLLSGQLLLSLVFMRSVLSHSKRMRLASKLSGIHDKDLPSLTIAIPARNETEELQHCLESLTASHYPKLEILVLDDCSQVARTPEIIKKFAHDGVRFIKGSEPKENWLAKNQAYETLARAANGEIILFCGVDTRFESDSLRQMVGYMKQKNKEMLCLMPINDLPEKLVTMIQPMRYAWELILPRRTFGQPPVLSSCWLIKADFLARNGGFGAASRMVVPEMYFANRASLEDAYSFLASGNTFGVSSAKKLRDQRDTAVRSSYPRLHRRPESVAGLAFVYIAWISLPLSVAVSMLTMQDFRYYLLVAIALIAVVLQLYVYALILKLSYNKARILDVVSLPLAALIYVALLIYSMYKYEFSEVVWKDRNICEPVMHVIPHLPRV